jgi:two-component system response regulator YesN
MTRSQSMFRRAAARGTVLVVDDEPVIAATLEAILISSGYDAHSFTSPQAALSFLRRHPVAVLITDGKMPVLSGMELGRQALQWRPECRVLLLSGQEIPAEESAGSAVEVLLKPVAPEELLHRLEAGTEVDSFPRSPTSAQPTARNL